MTADIIKSGMQLLGIAVPEECNATNNITIVFFGLVYEMKFVDSIIGGCNMHGGFLQKICKELVLATIWCNSLCSICNRRSMAVAKGV